MPVVRAQGVVKRVGRGRGARAVLDGADLEVRSGELVAILGRSGVGKSTMLNLLGGLDRPDGGTIEVAGQRIDRLGEADLTRYRGERVGFVFQLFHLIGELTAAQNVSMPAQDRRNGAGARAGELLTRLGVAGVADQLPHTLSGGEQQRVAIARALINDPELVLADEPTGNLDADSAASVLEILTGLRDEGRSLLVVTHDAEAAAIADRVLLLEDGLLRPRP
ncbi:MAG: ABC transporter ATP-binding protein [Thermoleophilaceae bacterium]